MQLLALLHFHLLQALTADMHAHLFDFTQAYEAFAVILIHICRRPWIAQLKSFTPRSYSVHIVLQTLNTSVGDTSVGVPTPATPCNALCKFNFGVAQKTIHYALHCMSVRLD